MLLENVSLIQKYKCHRLHFKFTLHSPLRLSGYAPGRQTFLFYIENLPGSRMLLIQLSLPLPLFRSLHLRLQDSQPLSLPLLLALLRQILLLLRLLLLVTFAVAMLCILVVLRRRRLLLLLLLLLCATPPIDDSKWLWLIRLPCFTSCCRLGQKGLHYTLLGTLDTFYFFGTVSRGKFLPFFRKLHSTATVSYWFSFLG